MRGGGDVRGGVGCAGVVGRVPWKGGKRFLGCGKQAKKEKENYA